MLEKSNIAKILGGIAAVITATATLLGVVLPALDEEPSPDNEMVETPNVLNYYLEDAAQVLTTKNLESRAYFDPDSTEEVGRVISQNPEGGTEIYPQTAVLLGVSANIPSNENSIEVGTSDNREILSVNIGETYRISPTKPVEQEFALLFNEQIKKISSDIKLGSCTEFDSSNLNIKNIGDRWKIFGGNLILLDFNSESRATAALEIIKKYNFDSICHIGGEMTYYLSNNQAPTGIKDRNEDCLSINPQNVEFKEIQNRWKVVDDTNWILDFGTSKENANRAYDIIKKYNFEEICFFYRGNASGMYFLS